MARFAGRPEIPREDLGPGIKRCFAKGKDLFESALVLLDAGKVEAAANVFVLAAQEIGKARLLRDACDTGLPRPKIISFSDHHDKIDSAVSVLGPAVMWLKRGAFQKDAFQSDAFDIAVPADEPTRLEVLYVNYGPTGWLNPPPIDAAELRANIERALADLPANEEALLR
ncbi:MAG: AbiV family abortive infection protein [Actinobacteria bacterium]|nr:AbiV family abortive infection protein [Actinomycetota bacterium]